jgi:hypothetical protein
MLPAPWEPWSPEAEIMPLQTCIQVSEGESMTLQAATLQRFQVGSQTLLQGAILLRLVSRQKPITMGHLSGRIPRTQISRQQVSISSLSVLRAVSGSGQTTRASRCMSPAPSIHLPVDLNFPMERFKPAQEGEAIISRLRADR